MASKKIIGIDLGTTNSVVAVMEGAAPKVLVNQQGVTKSGYMESTTGEVLEWVSKYGSVAFTLCGAIGISSDKARACRWRHPTKYLPQRRSQCHGL